VRAAHQIGVRTIVDLTTIDSGRDPEFMRQVATATAMTIVFATGLYSVRSVPYFARRSDQEIADLFIHELRNGVAGTGVRPGVIKVALSGTPMTDYESKIVTAAGFAHLDTGAPIAIHVEKRGGLDALKRLTGLGVPGDKVLIAHADSTADLDYHLEIVENHNAYLGFDRFGYEFSQRDSVRIALTLALISLGHADRILLSQDNPVVYIGRDSRQWKDIPETRNWSLTHLVQKILPDLRERGINYEVIQLMTVSNPARFLVPSATSLSS
jgi:phosphotriesterase-related protein